MYLTLDYIKYFIEEKKLDNNIDSNNFRNYLGILKIEKKEKLWDIYIKGPKDSLYEEGFFWVEIYFPLFSSNKGPEVRFKNKIYHLNASQMNGRINAFFLSNWDKKTSYAELLVGIYLFFIFEQNPESPNSDAMAKEYLHNRNEFDQKAKSWVTMYASGKLNDLYQIENKFDILIRKVNKLEKDQNANTKKIIELLEKLKLNNQNEGIQNNLISIIFQSLDKKVHCSIICKETDIFADVESSLYKKYPELIESKHFFIVNGKTINKIKTLNENGIKDNDIILLYDTEMNDH
jgi:ubiquitin-protein ligase